MRIPIKNNAAKNEWMIDIKIMDSFELQPKKSLGKYFSLWLVLKIKYS